LLHRLSFDVAGVQETEDSPVLGYILADELVSGIVNDKTHPFTPQHLIAYAAPLADALKALKDQEHMFVLGRKGVEGIITLADLNKPVSRMYMFSLISLLETHLAFWIEDTFGSTDWLTILSKSRVELAREHQAERTKRNQDLDLLECLQFCDKRKIALSSADIRSHLSGMSKRALGDLLKRAEKLRDNLAHSQSDLSAGTTWNGILSDVCSMETLLARSDSEAAKVRAKATR